MKQVWRHAGSAKESQRKRGEREEGEGGISSVRQYGSDEKEEERGEGGRGKRKAGTVILSERLQGGRQDVMEGGGEEGKENGRGREEGRTG